MTYNEAYGHLATNLFCSFWLLYQVALAYKDEKTNPTKWPFYVNMLLRTFYIVMAALSCAYTFIAAIRCAVVILRGYGIF